MKNSIFLFLFLSSCAYHQLRDDPLVAIQIHDRNGLSETISNSDKLEIYEQIDFFSSQPYQKVLRIYRKEGKNHSKITTYHPNGSLSQYLEAEEMRAHGAYKEWHPNGRLKLEATVIGGTADVVLGSQHDWLFDGLCRAWNEQGVLLAEIPYEKGFLQGKSIHYYESGQPKKELPYTNHQLEGEGREYYPTGSLKAKIHFHHGLQQGAAIHYFERGVPSSLEEWREGHLHQALYYNPEGKKVSEVTEGRGFQTLFQGGKIYQSVEIQNGIPEGLVKTYSPLQQLESICHIKEGKKQGEETIYYLYNQNPKMQLQWNEDTLHGTVRTWYSTGQLRSEREYCRNKKMGGSFAWYKNGALMLVEEYENDLLLKGRYYKKGAKEPISSIHNGTGIAHLYDEDGHLLHKLSYLKGKVIDPEE